MRCLVLFLGILAFALHFAACKETKKPPIPVEGIVNETGMFLTAQDSTAVKTLVTLFMDRVKRNSLDSAAMLLRTYELHKQPQPLDSAEFKRVKAMLEQFPVLDYQIEGIALKRQEENEVKCRVRISDAAYTNWRFKPVRYIGCWSLCLKESGDYLLK